MGAEGCKRRLTRHQVRAVRQRGRHMAVVAGAGSGKTLVLTLRYLAAFHSRQAELGQMVALTFTEKAATEMKERIREELAALLRRARRPDLQARWRRALQELEQAPICTLHSFCARLLRENPVEAGLDPQFTVLDRAAAEAVLYGLAEEEVRAGLERGVAGVALLVEEYGRSGLVRHLVSVFHQLRTAGLAVEEVRRRHGQRLAEAARRLPAACGELAGAWEELAAGVSEEKGSARRRWEEVQAAWAAARPRLEVLAAQADGGRPLDPGREEGWAAWADLLEVHRKLTGRAPERLRPLLEAIRDGYARVESLWTDLASQPYVESFLGLLEGLEARWRRRREETAALDYDDLQLLVRDLLRRPEVARRYQGRYRFLLVDEYQDINPLQQEIISLLAGLEGWPFQPAADAGGGEGRSPVLFLVGDPKQSIYGFRGAEAGFFHAAVKTLQERGGEVVPLRENFRTLPGLLAFVNLVGRYVFQGRAAAGGAEAGRTETAAAWEEGVPGRPGPLANPGSPVAELLLVPQSGTAEERRAAEAEAVAGRIEELVREEGRQYREIALLFRTLADVGLYERALRRRGIPYLVAGGRGLYQRPEVTDLFSLLRFLADPEDDLSLAAVLRSPLFGLSDDALCLLALCAGGPERGKPGRGRLWQALQAAEELLPPGNDLTLARRAAGVLEGLLLQRDLLAPHELLARAVAETDLVAFWAARPDGRQALANVRKLEGAVERIVSETGNSALSGFLAYLEEILEREAEEGEADPEVEEAQAVKLLTVHKAKGLEFPVVFLVDAGRAFVSESEGVLFDRERGLGLKVLNHEGEPLPTGLYREIQAALERRGEEEEARILYVAMTRARDYLIISSALSVQEGQEEPEPAGEAALEGQEEPAASEKPGSPKGLESSAALVPPPARARRRGSWLDWVLRATAEGWPEACPARAEKEARADFEFGSLRLRVAGGRAPERQRRVAAAWEEWGGEGAPGWPASGGPAAEAPPLTAAEQRALALASPWRTRPALSIYPVTALLELELCPRRYWYGHLWGIPEPLQPGVPASGEPEAGGEAGVAALALLPVVRGRVVHRVCEWLEGKEPDEEGLRRLVERAARAEGLAGRQLLDQVYAEVAPLLRRYLRSSLYRRVQEASRVFSEWKFRWRLERWVLSWVVDKILEEEREKSRALLLDFKTNRVEGEWLAEAAQRYRLQLEAYALAVRRLLGLEVQEAVLYFLEPDQVVSWPVDSAGAAEVQQRLAELCRRAEEMDGEDLPPGSADCPPWCGYRPLCFPERAAVSEEAVRGGVG
ncbi:MAG: UvrD-helicase domain-containing protein [Bacillota bacterium]|nr:UvrD-helicase domain-containing protein [Bacillota bacterium]